MENIKLFMLLIGCKPKGRHTEQHDVFFGCAANIKELLVEVNDFWPEAKSNFHIDAWRTVENVDGFAVSVITKEKNTDKSANANSLFFINLGGYKKEEFEEFHYKMVVAASEKGIAIQAAKQTAFYKHTGFKGATSHIDDKYGVDADDVHEIVDILPKHTRSKYSIVLTPTNMVETDILHLGYLPLRKIV